MIKHIIPLVAITILLFSCDHSKKETHLALNNSQTPELKESIQRGKLVYTDFCMSCHLPNGKGVPKAFPPLANSDYLKTKPEASIKAIKYGLSGEITVNRTTYNSAMVSQGLTDAEVADVMNYINNSWGNQNFNMITKEKVSKIHP